MIGTSPPKEVSGSKQPAGEQHQKEIEESRGIGNGLKRDPFPIWYALIFPRELIIGAKMTWFFADITVDRGTKTPVGRLLKSLLPTKKLPPF